MQNIRHELVVNAVSGIRFTLEEKPILLQLSCLATVNIFPKHTLNARKTARLDRASFNRL